MMKRMALLALPALLLLAASCGEGPHIAQGVVVSYDANTKDLVLKTDSDGSAELTFSLQGADFGAEPTRGDSLRLAYRQENGKRMTLRVMNLSKPIESQKKGH